MPAQATDLTFSYAGTTTVVPGPAPDNYPSGTELIIAWGRSVDAEAAGIGGALYVPGRTESGDDALLIERGMVLLDATTTATMTRGFGAAPGEPPVSSCCTSSGTPSGWPTR